MKTDITRSTHNPKKRYTGVRQQQGRVQLDSDWNEQVDIVNDAMAATTGDIVGMAGGPVGDLGFGLSISGTDLVIGAGAYYVDGLRVENDASVKLSNQPYSKGPTIEAGKKYIVYLRVFDRSVTGLEDSEIIESALGGPDTCTRTQRIWQVDLKETTSPLDCLSSNPEWSDLIAPSSMKLAAKTDPSQAPKTPCIVPSGSGYRSLENRLYRVEIRKVGTTSYYAWSRENGSVAALCTKDTNKITLLDPPRDDVRSFKVHDWVELIDHDTEMKGHGGQFVQITEVKGNVLTLSSSVTQGDQGLRVRRWDQGSDVKPIPANPNKFEDLEDGIQIAFKVGSCRVGDYWLIPARTLKGNIEWPGGFITPHGVDYHYARIGILDTTQSRWTLTDCRTPFASLTDVIALSYVSGDGQEGVPDLHDLNRRVPLLARLVVGVSRGRHPVNGARVKFEITNGTGKGKLLGVDAGGSAVSGTAIETTSKFDQVTKANGLAFCTWELDPGVKTDASLANQTVRVTMLDAAGGQIHLPVVFNANLSVAGEVAYKSASACSVLKDAKTVEQALDILCEEGCCEVSVGIKGDYPHLHDALDNLLLKGSDGKPIRKRIALCLMAQEENHEVKGQTYDFPGVSLFIRGCGDASRVVLDGETLTFKSFESVTLSNFNLSAVGMKDAIHSDSVGTMRIVNCTVLHVGVDADSAAIRSQNGINLTVSQNEIASFFKTRFNLNTDIRAFDANLEEFLQKDEVTFLAGLEIEATRVTTIPDRKGKVEVLSKSTKSDTGIVLPPTGPTLRNANLSAAGRIAATDISETTMDIDARNAAFASNFNVLGTGNVQQVRDALIQIRRLYEIATPTACLHVESPTTTAVIEKNIMAGCLAFYAGTPTLLENEDMARASERASGGAFSLKPSGGAVWVRGNSFDRFLLGMSVAQHFREDTQPEVETFRDIRFENNNIAFNRSASLALFAFFEGNLWLSEGEVALSVCERDVIVGNTGPYSNNEPNARFYDASIGNIRGAMREMNYLTIIG